MGYRVTISPRAERNFDAIQAYLRENFGERSANDLRQKLRSMVKAISEMPYMHPASRKLQGLRKCTVGRKTILFYMVFEEHVEIVSIYDGRTDPENRDFS